MAEVEVHMEVKPCKDSYTVNVYDRKRRAFYTNIIRSDYNTLCQILIDLSIEGFAVDKAVKKYIERMRKQDWLGF